MTVLADLLSTVFERRYRRPASKGQDKRPIEELASNLVGSAGETSGLALRPISWETPAHILEKNIAYEAINSWDDLRRRLQPTDHRCFAFFHPTVR